MHVDAEATIELRADVDASAGADGVADAIGGFGAALEVVDLAPVDGKPDGVVADNVFHRAVAFAPTMVLPVPTLEVRISVDGEERAAGSWPDDLADRLAKAAELLEAVGEKPRAGDKVITGSIVQVRVRCGCDVRGTFGDQASVELRIDGADDFRAV